MRVAITGATGRLGRVIAQTLAAHGHAVIAAVHKRPCRQEESVEALTLDLARPDSVTDFIRMTKAECIVHTAALTDVDWCEEHPAEAESLHATGTQNLLDAMAGSDTRIVYISTDYVFDGTSAPYREEDSPNPINVYGRTKRLGEFAVLGAGERHAIVRSASFIGATDPDHPSFLDTIAAVLSDDPPYRAAHDQYANVTSVRYLAEAVCEIATRALSGVWHVAGEQVLSRYELACRVSDCLNLPRSRVESVPYATLKRRAARPLNAGLVIEKARCELTVQPPALDAALSQWKHEWLASRPVAGPDRQAK